MPQPPQPQAQGGSCRRRPPTASPICGSATTATTSSFHPGTLSVTLFFSSSCSQGFSSFNSVFIWCCVHWGGACCGFWVVVWEGSERWICIFLIECAEGEVIRCQRQCAQGPILAPGTCFGLLLSRWLVRVQRQRRPHSLQVLCLPSPPPIRRHSLFALHEFHIYGGMCAMISLMIAFPHFRHCPRAWIVILEVLNP